MGVAQCKWQCQIITFVREAAECITNVNEFNNDTFYARIDRVVNYLAKRCFVNNCDCKFLAAEFLRMSSDWYAKDQILSMVNEGDFEELYKAAADSGLGKAQAWLAFCYDTGSGGLDEDKKEAARYFAACKTPLNSLYYTFMDETREILDEVYEATRKATIAFYASEGGEQQPPFKIMGNRANVLYRLLVSFGLLDLKPYDFHDERVRDYQISYWDEEHERMKEWNIALRESWQKWLEERGLIEVPAQEAFAQDTEEGHVNEQGQNEDQERSVEEEACEMQNEEYDWWKMDLDVNIEDFLAENPEYLSRVLGHSEINHPSAVPEKLGVQEPVEPVDFDEEDFYGMECWDDCDSKDAKPWDDRDTLSVDLWNDFDTREVKRRKYRAALKRHIWDDKDMLLAEYFDDEVSSMEKDYVEINEENDSAAEYNRLKAIYVGKYSATRSFDENQSIFPQSDFWNKIATLQQKVDILAEAIETNQLIEDTTLYILYLLTAGDIDNVSERPAN